MWWDGEGVLAPVTVLLHGRRSSPAGLLQLGYGQFLGFLVAERAFGEFVGDKKCVRFVKKKKKKVMGNLAKWATLNRWKLEEGSHEMREN